MSNSIMSKHHRITYREKGVEETLKSEDIIGLKVLSLGGEIIGKVSQLRINPAKMSLEGIFVSRGLFDRPLYIGTSYLKTISAESVRLKINPSILLKDRKVINSEGKKIGIVKKVIRKEHTNNIKELIISSFPKKDFAVPVSYVSLFGESIVLKSNYNVPKKYIWQKN